MEPRDKVLAIVPAWNEEHNLPAVLDELRAQPGVDVVVINDGSLDRTSAVARAAGVAVIDLPVNSGMFVAVQTGFRYAFREGYQVAVQVDADGQHDPSGIPDLVRPIVESGLDVVIGSRFRGEVQYTMPLARRLGTWLFGRVTSLAVGQRITDTTCGFRAYGPAVVRLFATETTFEFRDAVGLVMLHRGGFTMTEVPAVVRPRKSGRSSIGSALSLIYPFHYLLALAVVLLREPTRKA